MTKDSELRQLLDERAILRTLYRYSHSIDNGLQSDWVDCFTDDGTYEVGGEDIPEKRRARVEGREALGAYFAGRPTNTRQMHLVVNPLIELDGDRATVASYCVAYDSDEARPVVRVLGRYRDRLIKGADGNWRLEQRIFEGVGYRSPPAATLR